MEEGSQTETKYGACEMGPALLPSPTAPSESAGVRNREPKQSDCATKDSILVGESRKDYAAPPDRDVQGDVDGRFVSRHALEIVPGAARSASIAAGSAGLLRLSLSKGAPAFGDLRARRGRGGIADRNHRRGERASRPIDRIAGFTVLARWARRSILAQTETKYRACETERSAAQTEMGAGIAASPHCAERRICRCS